MNKMLVAVICGSLTLGSLSSLSLEEPAATHQAVDLELLRDRERCRLLHRLRDALTFGSALALSAAGEPWVKCVALSIAATFSYFDNQGIKKLHATNDKKAVKDIYEIEQTLTALMAVLLAASLGMQGALGPNGGMASAIPTVVIWLNPGGALDSFLDSVIRAFGLTVLPKTTDEQI